MDDASADFWSIRVAGVAVMEDMGVVLWFALLGLVFYRDNASNQTGQTRLKTN